MSAHSHVIGPKTYIKVLAALLILTAVTVAAAGVHFGSTSVNVVIALAIATVKGSLVALYFMHLRYDKPMYAIIFVTGMIFLAIFLGFSLVDIGARRDPAPPFKAASATAAPSDPRSTTPNPLPAR